MYSLVKITVFIGDDIIRDLEGIERDVFVSPERIAVLAYQYFTGHQIVSIQKVMKEDISTVVELADHTKQNITVIVTIQDKLTEAERN